MPISLAISFDFTIIFFVRMQNEFVNYLLESLEAFGPVRAQAMFGGFGIFRQNLMFGLVDQDTLYLKADDHNRVDFEAGGLRPFTYKRKGEEVALSYYQAPHQAIDDSEDLCRWAQQSYEAAVRATQTRQKKRRGA